MIVVANTAFWHPLGSTVPLTRTAFGSKLNKGRVPIPEYSRQTVFTVVYPYLRKEA
jgi:hypothetical protein